MKRSLRRTMRSRLRAIDPELRREISSRACRRLRDQPEWSGASVVFVYVATPTEIDTRPLIEVAWREGRRVVAPKILDFDAGLMRPVEIRSWADCRPGHRNLLEPVGELEVPAERIDLVVVPGLAFDDAGRRLGQGGGFYDRFLGRVGDDSPGRDRSVCGFGYETQVVDRVPSEPHDRAIDLLVTELAVRRFPRVATPPGESG